MAGQGAAHNDDMQTNHRQRRERLSVSQSDLARLADVSLSTVQVFERGTRPMSDRVRRRILKALDDLEERGPQEIPARVAAIEDQVGKLESLVLDLLVEIRSLKAGR